MTSRRQFDACFPITGQTEVADLETPKLTGRFSVPLLTFRTSSEVKRSKVKVSRTLNAVTENQPYLRNGKACKSPLAVTGHIVSARRIACSLSG